MPVRSTALFAGFSSSKEACCGDVALGAVALPQPKVAVRIASSRKKSDDFRGTPLPHGPPPWGPEGSSSESRARGFALCLLASAPGSSMPPTRVHGDSGTAGAHSGRAAGTLGMGLSCWSPQLEMANIKAKIAPTCEGASRVHRGLPTPSPPLAPCPCLRPAHGMLNNQPGQIANPPRSRFTDSGQ